MNDFSIQTHTHTFDGFVLKLWCILDFNLSSSALRWRCRCEAYLFILISEIVWLLFSWKQPLGIIMSTLRLKYRAYLDRTAKWSGFLLLYNKMLTNNFLLLFLRTFNNIEFRILFVNMMSKLARFDLFERHNKLFIAYQL